MTEGYGENLQCKDVSYREQTGLSVYMLTDKAEHWWMSMKSIM